MVADEENVSVVRRSFEALDEGDLDRLFECFTEDCVFDGSRIAEGVYEGSGHYRAFLQGALDSVAPRHTDLEFRQAGDHVLATGTLVGLGQTSGAHTEMPVAYVYALRDGLIARQTMFTNAEQAEEVFRTMAASGS